MVKLLKESKDQTYQDEKQRNLEMYFLEDPQQSIKGQSIMQSKIKKNNYRSKRGAKERAFRMIKIIGQGAFANVYLVESKNIGSV